MSFGFNLFEHLQFYLKHHLAKAHFFYKFADEWVELYQYEN